MRVKQTNLFEYSDKLTLKKRYNRTLHGGTNGKGERKQERPLSTRHSLHLVLKSDKATGKLSFLTPKNQIAVRRILYRKARKFGIRIADYANVGNHLHLRVRLQSRLNFQKFLKSVTSLIARTITGARRGKKFGRFWQGLAFTRVLKSYTEEMNVRGYITANEFEAANSYEARERYLKIFNRWLYKQRLKRRSRTE